MTERYQQLKRKLEELFQLDRPELDFGIYRRDGRRANGGNNLDGLRRAEDTWRVRLIEEDFHRLMFAESSP